MAKLPYPPDIDRLREIGIRTSETSTPSAQMLWWRLHRTTGEHVLPWNALRYFGPLDARFEPHQPPPRTHTDRAVWYAAERPRTCIAEVYQRTRRVHRGAGGMHLTSARLTRPVHLLDLTGTGKGAWQTRAGASLALGTGRHDVTSAWARTICSAFADLDGLIYRAPLDGGHSIALFHPARDAMPLTPVTTRSIADPALGPALAGLCSQIGYRLI